MKANTRNIMESHWDIDYMSLYWRGQKLNSKHTKHSYDRKFKNKWRNEIKKQAEQEISEL